MLAWQAIACQQQQQHGSSHALNISIAPTFLKNPHLCLPKLPCTHTYNFPCLFPPLLSLLLPAPCCSCSPPVSHPKPNSPVAYKHSCGWAWLALSLEEGPGGCCLPAYDMCLFNSLLLHACACQHVFLHTSCALALPAFCVHAHTERKKSRKHLLHTPSHLFFL